MRSRADAARQGRTIARSGTLVLALWLLAACGSRGTSVDAVTTDIASEVDVPNQGGTDAPQEDAVAADAHDAATDETADDALGPDIHADAEDAVPADASPWPDVPLEGAYADLEGLSGPALAHALCQLTRQGYQTLSYDEARAALFDVVDNTDGDVREVYTGAWLPADSPLLNTEHSWPQSLGATGGAKSDLHHLFPSRADFNSARGNLPYGTVQVPDWPPVPIGDANCTDHLPGHPAGCFSRRGTDFDGIAVFEPRDAHKGNAARALFYFAVRWGSIDCKPRPFHDLDPDHPEVTVATLRAWHVQDPPDDAERVRNDRVQALQQTRNPFVDHPEFVDSIAF